MAILKVWFIEEILLDGGEIGHRQTVMEFDSATGNWIRPDSRLVDSTAQSNWDYVMTRVQNVGGQNLSYCVNPVGLLDLVNNQRLGRPNRKRGTGDDYSVS